MASIHSLLVGTSGNTRVLLEQRGSRQRDMGDRYRNKCIDIQKEIGTDLHIDMLHIHYVSATKDR